MRGSGSQVVVQQAVRGSGSQVVVQQAVQQPLVEHLMRHVAACCCGRGHRGR